MATNNTIQAAGQLVADLMKLGLGQETEGHDPTLTDGFTDEAQKLCDAFEAAQDARYTKYFAAEDANAKITKEHKERSGNCTIKLVITFEDGTKEYARHLEGVPHNKVLDGIGQLSAKINEDLTAHQRVLWDNSQLVAREGRQANREWNVLQRKVATIFAKRTKYYRATSEQRNAAVSAGRIQTDFGWTTVDVSDPSNQAGAVRRAWQQEQAKKSGPLEPAGPADLPEKKTKGKAVDPGEHMAAKVAAAEEAK